MNKFNTFHLKPTLIAALDAMHIKEPTPIQSLSLNLTLAGRDVIGQAQTGTGKTLAFLIPMLNTFTPQVGHVQGLILTPTRELALQITEVAKSLCLHTSHTVLSLYGGQDLKTQVKRLNKPIDLIIATPGRLMDHMSRDILDLSKLSCLVLDEADQMLDFGFQKDVEHILKALPKERQTLCFSATMNSKVNKLCYRMMKDCEVVKVDTNAKARENIDQYWLMTTENGKAQDLIKLLENTNPFLGIIFCNARHRADKLEGALIRRGFSCAMLHGSMSQTARQNAMKDFRNAKFQYLIATDIAARGVDVKGISHIYNYDVPDTLDTYLHRMGRSGRMEESGAIYSLVCPHERRTFEQMNTATGRPATQIKHL